MRIDAVYGGAFDPPHLGHIEVVRRVLELPNVRQVIVMPSRNPPHKKPVASYRRRMHMTKLVMEDVFHGEKVSVSNIETRVRDVTYLVDVMRFWLWGKNQRYDIVLGTDEVRSLSRWKQPENIFGHAGMIIVNRPGIEELSQEEMAASNEIGFYVNLRITDAPKISLHDGFWMSSSEIRKWIAADYYKWRQCVPRSIAQYIENNRLYGYSKGAKQ